MNLLSMILNVISDGDTSNDILNKINIEFPDYIKRKIKQKGTKKAGFAQARAEISANIGHEEGNIFSINKDVKPYTYSEIPTDQIDEIFNTYIREIQEIESLTDAPETAYYYSLKTLLLNFSKKYLQKDIRIMQQKHHSFGVPDFTVYKDKNRKEILGIIECKRPDIDLITIENHTKHGEQIRRYRREIDNVIFTNFYDFKLHNNDKLKHKLSLDKDKKVENMIKVNIINLLTQFLSDSKNKPGNKNKDFIIHGRRLTGKQVKQLRDNKKVKITRDGYRFCLTQIEMTITEKPKPKTRHNDYIVEGKMLTKKQIKRLKKNGLISVVRNGKWFTVEND